MGKQATRTATMTTTVDPYARITSRILADLEQGVRPWVKPWTTGAPGQRVTRPLRATGEPYTGINVLLLWMEAVSAGHASPTWMTYKQAQALGGQVRGGEKGSPIIYYGSITTREDRPPASSVAPGRGVLVPPETIAEMQHVAAMRATAMLAAPLGASEPDEGGQLAPVDRIEPAMFACDRHDDSMSQPGVERKRKLRPMPLLAYKPS